MKRCDRLGCGRTIFPSRGWGRIALKITDKLLILELCNSCYNEITPEDFGVEVILKQGKNGEEDIAVYEKNV
jgi:hypothetical protein